MPRRAVALLIETSNEYARGLLRGILRYQQEHDSWSIELPELQRGADPPQWLKRYRGDGIIARIETATVAHAIRQTKLPVIDVSAARHIPEIPWIETDDEQVARLAVEHFLARGLTQLAYCGETAFNWSRWRGEAYVRLANAAGCEVTTFDLEHSGRDQHSAGERKRLLLWLKKLPQPCGLFAAYDILARQLIDLGTQLGRSIPNSLAILGVDNDPLLCQLATPALSSIIPDAEGAGYLAAQKLEQLMNGQPVTATAALLRPLGIAVRRSTDTLAVDDEIVSRAARYILAEACHGICAHDVVSHCGLSRRRLETRFRSALGKSPHEFIIQTRLDQAERLLRDTDLPLSVVAVKCGIEYAEYLNTLFRKHRGITPGTYRNQHR